MAIKERHSNPQINDTLRLRFNVFSGGSYANPHHFDHIDIYKLYGTDQTIDNPLGRLLIDTISADDISEDDLGKFHIDLDLEFPKYVQGKYQDDWFVIFEADSNTATHTLNFEVKPSVWFVDDMPIVHDIGFSFRPNRIQSGSKKYLEVKLKPDVPRGTDKQRYYENIAVASEIYISIKQTCGACLPAEDDLRTIVDTELLTERDGCVGYYLLDTTEMDCGNYDVWFEAHLGPNVYISSKEPLQIFS